jgi:hypothetical protein
MGEWENQRNNKSVVAPPRLPPSSAPPSTTRNPELVRVQSTLRMVGVVDNGHSAVALLEETDTGRHYTVKAGDHIGDVQAVSVDAGRVVVKQAGVRRELLLASSSGKEATRGGGAKPADVELERRIIPQR